MLLQQIEQQPETMGLKRLLAVKKSLLEFEQRVEHVMKVVQQLLTDNKVSERLRQCDGDLTTTGYWIYNAHVIAIRHLLLAKIISRQ